MRFYRGLGASTSGASSPARRRSSPAQAAGMLWGPRVTRRARGRGAGARRRRDRTGASRSTWSRSSSLALVGLRYASRGRSPCSRSRLLAYNTLAAMVFVGNAATASPWDFLLALLAAVALERLWLRVAHAMRVVHVHRIARDRRLGAPPADARCPRCARAAIDARSSGSTTSRLGSGAVLRRARPDASVPYVRLRSARRSRAARSAGRMSCTRTSSTPTCSARSSAADARSSRRSTTTIRSAPARSASSSGRSPAERRG